MATATRDLQRSRLTSERTRALEDTVLDLRVLATCRGKIISQESGRHSRGIGEEDESRGNI